MTYLFPTFTTEAPSRVSWRKALDLTLRPHPIDMQQGRVVESRVDTKIFEVGILEGGRRRSHGRWEDTCKIEHEFVL